MCTSNSKSIYLSLLGLIQSNLLYEFIQPLRASLVSDII